ncbi:DUF1793-domain-containing protein [Schizopora paradoxa]|uniref:DUF1793-domain-containing protein n=1 Tax=Schizopora paradoxa TaxID=27342 RepID=A0A0H2S1M0_9AGAM|nr:DUF1793-domain-containing protein [Schizopora paradoxa]
MAPSLIFLLFLLQIFALCSHQVVAQTGPKTWQTLPFNPGALPLAVRSPYLNTWAAQGNNPASVNNLWPTLWNSNITGWYAAVTVDGVAYRVLGDAPIQNTTTANQTAVIFTPTQTSVLLQAGPVSINATFLSPVEPTDLVRQSIPFSYFFMTAQSSDGANHDVKMYSDISAEWISGDDNREVIWTSDVNNDRVILSTQLQTESPFTDFSDHAHDSTAYYCMKAVSGLTWRIGADVQDRGIFTNTSQLTNTTDPNFRPVSDSWPVFGIAVDVGSVGSTPSSPVIWGIGVVRNQSVQYLGSDATTKQRSAYYWANFTTAVDVAEFFLNDFDRAVSAANEMDAKILSDAGGQNIPQFANLLSLSLRQAMASSEITISKDSSGNWNTSDVMTFMKNMGSAGNQGGVNNVDTLYASLPVFLYLNPSLAGYLLRPLLEYQESTAFNLPYAAQNPGVSYPIATGNSTQHNFGIEQSANMLIMTLAHAQASGDGTLLSQHYNKLLTWTDYLVNNSLSPNNQFSADVGSVNSVNQTNLALKGIIGIGAMAKICSYAGQQDQSSKYQSTAQNYIQQWAALTVASDQSHLLMNYGVQSSSGLVYNLYADKLLGLNLVPTSVYQVQQNFYITAAPQVKFGLPLDNSDATFSRTDWMMFAASSSGQDALGPMVNQLISFASVNMNNAPFASMYDPTSGQVSGGLNSPGQGAMFAPLVLKYVLSC